MLIKPVLESILVYEQESSIQNAEMVLSFNERPQPIHFLKSVMTEIV